MVDEWERAYRDGLLHRAVMNDVQREVRVSRPREISGFRTFRQNDLFGVTGSDATPLRGGFRIHPTSQRQTPDIRSDETPRDRRPARRAHVPQGAASAGLGANPTLGAVTK